MRITSLFAVSALLVPALAGAQEAAAPAPMASEKMGLSAGLNISYASPNKTYDKDGKSTDIPDEVGVSLMLINLGIGYDFGKMVPGLTAGLDLPIAKNAVSVDGGDGFSGSGLGDLSLYGAYLHPVNDQVKLGGKLRFKAATGKSAWDELDADQLATGSGHHNVQASLLVDAAFDAVGVGLDAGYVMTMGRKKDGAEANPGDAIYGDLGVGYQVNDMIKPALHVVFAQVGNVSSGPEGKTESIDDTGASWLALGLDVGIKVNDMISANIGLGTPMTALPDPLTRAGAYGLNVPYGFVLSGKNVGAGVLALNLGAKASF
jgi:hypothetical protein